ncbi:cytochrome-c peroxidase [Falsirhodobacter sp. 20TX0035]|uniref:cytochrome-c peroxidase n=1 Tax=Falsirhodobacter sp. 20TX0035 TaxID=3022019 RepID=UPI00232FD5A9|nr:cytochrome c peroxidase [Falsirhodobacter sp. 20TX0035]MDB6453069.1 cytochrome c peroxidase [Falsirhodobacter sp. 20TX0035]
MTDDIRIRRAGRGCRKAGRLPIVALAFLLAGGVTGAHAQGTPLSGEPITPVPLDVVTDPARVSLGQRLFSDTRLSGDNSISCSSCHMIARGGADGLRLSRGPQNRVPPTNTPTILNVSLSALLNWNGRNRSLTGQLREVVTNPHIMDGEWPTVLARLRADTALAAEFRGLYPDGITQDSVIDALAEYERSLLTPNAPFDRYLRGEADALSPEAKAGYELFKFYGCVSCHQGVNVGGNMLQAFGIFGSPAAAEGGPDTPGAARDTGISPSEPVFRVPSLRNVAQTAPYFHNGSVQTLPEAIDIMANYQLGRSITPDDIAQIEAFLNSLTGEYQGIPLGDYQP